MPSPAQARTGGRDQGRGQRPVRAGRAVRDRAVGRIPEAHPQFLEVLAGNQVFFSDAGKKLTGPDDPNWNGLVVPYDQQYSSYTNTLRSYGGSAKLEWQAPDNSLYASIMGFGRRRYEDPP
jgi:hypothetical protein